MPINPNIALSVQAPTGATQLPNVGGMVNQFANDVLALRQQEAESAAASQKALSEADKVKAKAWVDDLIRVDHAMANNRPDVANAIFQRRISTVEDPTDSINMQRMLLSEDPEERTFGMSVLQNELGLAVRNKLIEPGKLGETKEIKSGNELITQRVDPGTGRVGEVARTRREKRTPEEIAAEAALSPEDQQRVQRARALGMDTDEAFRQKLTKGVRIAAAGAARTSNQTIVKTDKFGDAVAKAFGKSFDESRVQAEAAEKTLLTVVTAKRLLKNTDVLTGTFARGRVGIAKALDTMGIDLGQGNSAAATEAFINVTANLVTELMGSGVLGAGSALSDADLKFAREVSANDPNMSLYALVHTLELIEFNSQFVLDRFNKMAESAMNGKVPDLRVGVDERPVFTSSVHRALGLEPGATYDEFQDAIERREGNNRSPTFDIQSGGVSTDDLRDVQGTRANPEAAVQFQTNEAGERSLDFSNIPKRRR